MFVPAKQTTQSYLAARDEWAAAGELIELLAEFEILSIHLDACGAIVVDLDATGLSRLNTRIYRLQAADILGLDLFDKLTQEWRGTWKGLDVGVRAYKPRPRLRDRLSDLIDLIKNR